MKPLVSIITPCYNGEKFLNRYFDSVLNQTYPNIELIFINDGSKDKTEEIALSYKEKIEQKGYSFHYIYQENAGQAAAINKGLSLIKGEYITWPDSDDWMTEDCIEKKVNYLQTHSDKGLVLCRTAVVDEKNNIITGFMQRDNISKEMLFEDLLFMNDVYFAPGGYMVRASMFFEMLPDKKIFEGQCGQNWQLLLPITYKYPCGFINDVLYYYLERQSSHSHSNNTLLKKYNTVYCQYDALVDTIKKIDMAQDVKRGYLNVLSERYAQKYFSLAYQIQSPKLMRKEYFRLKHMGIANKFNMDAYWEICHPIIYKFKQVIKEHLIIIKRICRKL